MRWVSPASEALSASDRLAAETPRQIANAHTLFNVANTFILIWFSGLIGRLVERLVPDEPLSEPVDGERVKTPQLAPELWDGSLSDEEIQARVDLGVIQADEAGHLKHFTRSSMLWWWGVEHTHYHLGQAGMVRKRAKSALS